MKVNFDYPDTETHKFDAVASLNGFSRAGLLRWLMRQTVARKIAVPTIDKLSPAERRAIRPPKSK